MRRTALKGHSLRDEGKAFERGEYGGQWIRVSYAPSTGSLSGVAYIGVALCECGTTSPALRSDGARKRWHADHKAGIRALMEAGNEEGGSGGTA